MARRTSQGQRRRRLVAVSDRACALCSVQPRAGAVARFDGTRVQRVCLRPLRRIITCPGHDGPRRRERHRRILFFGAGADAAATSAPLEDVDRRSAGPIAPRLSELAAEHPLWPPHTTCHAAGRTGRDDHGHAHIRRDARTDRLGHVDGDGERHIRRHEPHQVHGKRRRDAAW